MIPVCSQMTAEYQCNKEALHCRAFLYRWLNFVNNRTVLFTFAGVFAIMLVDKLDFVGVCKMIAYITVLGLGILVCVLGAINMTGNISSIHSYHRHRVTQENIKPFGKLVGLGTLLIGISMIVFGILFFIFEQTGIEALTIIATAQLVVSIAVGTLISFYAMKKYNGGIF